MPTPTANTMDETMHRLEFQISRRGLNSILRFTLLLYSIELVLVGMIMWFGNMYNPHGLRGVILSYWLALGCYLLAIDLNLITDLREHAKRYVPFIFTYSGRAFLYFLSGFTMLTVYEVELIYIFSLTQFILAIFYLIIGRSSFPFVESINLNGYFSLRQQAHSQQQQQRDSSDDKPSGKPPAVASDNINNV